MPNDRGFGAYGGVAVPYGDSFVYVGGSTIDANSADVYRSDSAENVGCIWFAIMSSSPGLNLAEWAARQNNRTFKSKSTRPVSEQMNHFVCVDCFAATAVKRSHTYNTMFIRHPTSTEDLQPHLQV